MGQLGQQLVITFPPGAGKVRLSGKNQNWAIAEWDGVCGNLTGYVGPGWGVHTDGWWWRGVVTVWWDDSNGNTQTFLTAPVPDQLYEDYWFQVAPYPDSTGRTVKTPHGEHEVKPPHGEHQVKESHGEHEEKSSPRS